MNKIIVFIFAFLIGTFSNQESEASGCSRGSLPACTCYYPFYTYQPYYYYYARYRPRKYEPQQLTCICNYPPEIDPPYYY